MSEIDRKVACIISKLTTSFGVKMSRSQGFIMLGQEICRY